jgi:hypothetical protein
MGGAKDNGMRLAELVEQAKDILIHTGASHKCKIHDDVLLDSYDEQAQSHAYAIATNKFKAGEFGRTLQEARDAIQTAIHESGMECPSCPGEDD